MGWGPCTSCDSCDVLRRGGSCGAAVPPSLPCCCDVLLGSTTCCTAWPPSHALFGCSICVTWRLTGPASAVAEVAAVAVVPSDPSATANVTGAGGEVGWVAGGERGEGGGMEPSGTTGGSSCTSPSGAKPAKGVCSAGVPLRGGEGSGCGRADGGRSSCAGPAATAATAMSDRTVELDGGPAGADAAVGVASRAGTGVVAAGADCMGGSWPPTVVAAAC